MGAEPNPGHSVTGVNLRISPSGFRRCAAPGSRLLRFFPRFESLCKTRKIKSFLLSFRPIGCAKSAPPLRSTTSISGQAVNFETGSVWPHDNALIAAGMARYGCSESALRIFAGLFDAALYCDLYRLPELFCGFARRAGEGPVLYPVASAPQAWSAAAVFLLLQACLGVTVDAVERKITFVRPMLPPFLNRVCIGGLSAGRTSLDLLIVRRDDDIRVNVLDHEEDFEVVVVPLRRM